jgi:protein-tyrosine phosphatase
MSKALSDWQPSFTLSRDAEGILRLSWTEEVQLPFRVYAGQTLDTIDDEEPLMTVRNGHSVVVPGQNSAARHYLAIVTEDGTRTVVAERGLQIEGVRNFRDIGGYPTTDGHYVKWGQVYRSAGLNEITPAGLEALAALGIRLVCDMRGAEEYASAPDILPEAPAPDVLQVPVISERSQPSYFYERISNKELDEFGQQFMIDLYLQFVDEFAPSFGQILRHLADPANLPALIHCTAGKDRTGLAIAFLLLSLGVPESVVVSDYDLSNTYLADRIEGFLSRLRNFGVPEQKLQNMLPVFSAPRILLESALAHIKRNYRSVEDYLREEAGVDEATVAGLRENLLAKV